MNDNSGPDREDPTTQVIQAGAVINLDDAVLEFGILFHHPDMPPFKLFMQVDKKEGKTIVGKYFFEIVKKINPLIQRFVVDIAVVKKSSIVMPPEAALIKPGDKQ